MEAGLAKQLGFFSRFMLASDTLTHRQTYQDCKFLVKDLNMSSMFSFANLNQKNLAN
jgi:hypothetical protein